MPKLRTKLRFGLQGALLTAFISLSIVTVSLVAIVSIWFGIRTSQNLVLAQLIADVELNEQAIDNWLDERRYNLDVILRSPADVALLQEWVQTPANQRVYAALQARLWVETQTDGRFAEVFLLDAAGRVVLSTDDESLGKNHRHQTHFQEGLRGPFVSGTFFNVTAAEHQIIVALPVLDATGNALGVLAGRLRVADLTRFVLSRADTTATGQVYLVSQDRQFITALRFAPQSSLARSEGIDRGLGLDPTARNDEGIYLNYNGVRVVGAYRWLPELRVVLLSERDEREALAGMWQLVVFILGAAGFGILAAVGLGRFSTYRIIQPVTRLTEAATALANGDLTRSLAIESDNEIGVLAQAFTMMTERLRELINSLEARVAARTKRLEAIATLSEELNAILDVDVLLPHIVELIQERFDLYYAGLFLVDETRQWAVLRAGSGVPGQAMLAAGHRLQIGGRSMIGAAILNQQARIALDVGEEAVRFSNPHLPETHSEMALPLISRGGVIGALTIQSTQSNAFLEEDITELQTVANQVAVAIDNARLFAESQATLQEVEAVQRRYFGQAWSTFLQDTAFSGYRQTPEGMLPLTQALLPEVQRALALEGQAIVEGDLDGAAQLVVPITFRDQAIGALGFKEEGARVWTEEELALVEAIAEQLALAADNLRLLDETQRRATRERLTREVTDNIRAAVSVEDALRRALEQMGRLFSATEMVARIGAEDALLNEPGGGEHE